VKKIRIGEAKKSAEEMTIVEKIFSLFYKRIHTYRYVSVFRDLYLGNIQIDRIKIILTTLF
jgi:hypothetical protein